MPRMGFRKVRNVYGERFNKPFKFKYDGEEYTIPLAGEINEMLGDVSTGNDIWNIDLAEKAAKDMAVAIIMEDEQYWYEQTKPRGQVVTVKGGVKLQDEELMMELLEKILGPKPSDTGKQQVSMKEQMKEMMAKAKDGEESFPDLAEDKETELYDKIESEMSWNDIQKAAKEREVPVTTKQETINALIASGYTM